MQNEPLICLDLFCGSGGGTTGMLEAAAQLGLELDVLAVNHWPVAIATHETNHPNVRHICENLECVWPRQVVPGGKVHLALFAPECTGHSRASGGRPKSEQSRATAWHVVRWAEELDIENILVENVQEFVDWGPLYPDDHEDEKLRGRPIPEKKGTFFRDWISTLRKRGYRAEYRILNAAYFGAKTSRTRFFLQAKKIRAGKRPRITWPETTHDTSENLFGKPRFRAAREIIDWDLPGQSVFNRKKPLAPNTMRRVFAGLEKFSGLPFLMGQQSCAAPRSTDEPVPTVATAGAISMVQPFLVVFRGSSNGQSVEAPIGTITTTGKHHYLAEPFVVPVTHGGGENRCNDLGNPLPTVTGAHGGELALVAPYLVKYHGSHQNRSDCEKRVYSVEEPIKTLDTQPRFGIAEPYLVSYKGNDNAKDLEEPLATLTTRDRFALCEPFVLPPEGIYRGNAPRPIDGPMQTLTTRGGGQLVQPFIVPYYGNSEAVSIEDPLDTVTTRDRFALVAPEMIEICGIDKGDIVGLLDIRFRMLQPHELSAAMGFPADYQFTGTKEQKTKQIGNAIEVNMARALCYVMLQGYAPKRKKINV